MNATPRTPLKKRPMNNMRECVCMRACAENLIVRTSSTELEKDEDAEEEEEEKDEEKRRSILGFFFLFSFLHIFLGFATLEHSQQALLFLDSFGRFLSLNDY